MNFRKFSRIDVGDIFNDDYCKISTRKLFQYGLSVKNRLSVKLSPAVIVSELLFFYQLTEYYTKNSHLRAPKTWYVPKFKKKRGGVFEKSRFFQRVGEGFAYRHFDVKIFVRLIKKLTVTRK